MNLQRTRLSHCIGLVLAAQLGYAAPVWAFEDYQWGDQYHCQGTGTYYFFCASYNQAGGNAIANATSGDPSNAAYAFGGDGGWGVNGPVGGGADATATASTEAVAQAFGGVGGVGVVEGGGSGSTGGAGGSGTASAIASGGTGGIIHALTRAEGGTGGMGDIAGTGGSASAETGATGSGTDVIVVEGYARGGAGSASNGGQGSAGGNATSTSWGQWMGGVGYYSYGNSVQATAVGGNGSDSAYGYDDGTGVVWSGANGGNGGSGYSTATGSSVDGIPLNVGAYATGGNGGTASGVGFQGGQGGAGSVVFASGQSSGAGTVAVEAYQQGGNGGGGVGGANGGDGANSYITDAVNGTTQGALVLTQNAIGGSGGYADGGGLAGRGGNASSYLSAANLEDTSGSGIGTRSLTGSVTGTGGDGGTGWYGLSNSGDGGVGRASIHLYGTDAHATATAVGGNGGDNYGGGRAGAGGWAFLDEVYAFNAPGGNISASGTVRGGNGGNTHGFGPAGDGAIGFARNNVDGYTTQSGSLTLSQSAYGGNSGSVMNGGGPNGTAGSAFSELASIKSVGNLDVSTDAQGGKGGDRYFDGTAANGADATARSSASGADARVGATSHAIGGSGGAGFYGATGGIGGNATAVANGGSLNQNSSGDVSAFAEGGAGGQTQVLGLPVGQSLDQDGAGGNADASATGVATGSLVVGASAQGGKGRLGGNANASATGTANTGYLNVSAGAVGGEGAQGNQAGSALATATGSLGSYVASSTSQSGGRVDASASTSSGIVHGVWANASASTPLYANLDGWQGVTQAGASIGANALATNPAANLNAGAYATALPDSTQTLAALAGNTRVAEAFGSADVLGLAIMGGYDTSASGIYTSGVSFSFDMSQRSNDHLLMGLMNPGWNGSSINALYFSVMAEGNLVANQVFYDLTSANDYFSDNLLDLGLWSDMYSSDQYLDLSFNLIVNTSEWDSGFDTTLMFASAPAVPVPGAVWLFGSGLLGLIGVAKRKRLA